MKGVISLVFLISIIQVINVSFVSSVQDWPSEYVDSQLEVRTTLPDTGYWNFLTIGGLYGRMLHFLITDTDGFGLVIQGLKAKFKQEYGDEYYTELESHVAEHFPIMDTMYQSKLMISKLSDIRDEKTQKTLGDAIQILQNIADDRKAVNTIVDRWHMLKKVVSIFKNPEDDKIDDALVNKLKILLLEHPEVFQKLLVQPDVLNRLSDSVIQSLQGIDPIKAIQSIPELIFLLKTLYPQNYQQIFLQLLQIRDIKTNISFADGLETVSNVVQTQVFQDTLRTLLDTYAQGQVHGTSQQSFKNPDPKEVLDRVDPEMIQQLLGLEGIVVSVEKAQSLLEDVKNDELLKKLLSVVKKAEEENGKLTAEIVSNSLATVQIFVNPKKVARLMQLFQSYSLEMIKNKLEGVGIIVKMSELEEVEKQAKKVSPSDLETFDPASPSSPPGTFVPSSETSSSASDPSQAEGKE